MRNEIDLPQISTAKRIIMSGTTRARLKSVNENEFAELVEQKIEEQFQELWRSDFLRELGKGFLQANVTLNFVVLARKPKAGEAAKACCKCHYDKKDPD